MRRWHKNKSFIKINIRKRDVKLGLPNKLFNKSSPILIISKKKIKKKKLKIFISVKLIVIKDVAFHIQKDHNLILNIIINKFFIFFV